MVPAAPVADAGAANPPGDYSAVVLQRSSRGGTSQVPGFFRFVVERSHFRGGWRLRTLLINDVNRSGQTRHTAPRGVLLISSIRKGQGEKTEPFGE